MKTRHLTTVRAAILVSMLTALIATGCSGTLASVTPDEGSHRVVASAGQDVLITLGNVGPATYEAPPQISSNVVSYLDVSVVPPFTPAGPNQQFRLLAVHSGEAVVTFQRTLNGSVVSTVRDTIEVR